jgi:hypothetical protein
MQKIRKNTTTEEVSTIVDDGKKITTKKEKNVIVTEKVVNQRYDEKFVSLRKTWGIWWITKFNGSELMMMLVLLNFEDLETHVIILEKTRRKFLCELFKVTERQIYNIIRGLIKKHALIKVDSFKLILNPSYIYNGSYKSVKHRIEDFYKRYNSVYKTCIIPEMDIVYLPEELEGILR